MKYEQISAGELATWLESIVAVFVPNPEEKISGDELILVNYYEGVLKQCLSVVQAHAAFYGEDDNNALADSLERVLRAQWAGEPQVEPGCVTHTSIALYLVALGTKLDQLETVLGLKD